MSKNPPLIFSGTSHKLLAEEVAKQCSTTLGKVSISCYPDQEIGVRIQEDVRGKEVFILQSCVTRPNHYLMELVLMIDALKRAGASSIVPLLPYFPYCRQDRISEAGQPIAARVVSKILESAGATKMFSIDLHQGQLEGFFDTPFLQLHAREILIPELKKHQFENPIFVGPDVGSIKIARAWAKEYGADFMVIDKHRSPDGTIDMRPIGSVEGREVIIIDDICSTATTLTMAATLCHRLGAKKIVAVVTHALFVDGAIDHILTSPIESLFFTDTLPVKEEIHLHYKFHPTSIAPLIAKGIDALSG